MTARITTCNCDEMIARTQYLGSSTSITYRPMALSWRCLRHGQVTVDHRPSHTTINNPPDPVASERARQIRQSRTEVTRPSWQLPSRVGVR